MEPSKEWVGNSLTNDLRRGTRDKLNHTGWNTGLLQQLVYNIVRVRCGGRRLPQYDITDESRDTREVATDSGEIERRNCKDETLERTIFHPAEDICEDRRWEAVDKDSLPSPG